MRTMKILILSQIIVVSVIFLYAYRGHAEQAEWDRLVTAIRDNDTETVKKIIDAGIDLSRAEKEVPNWTSLHWWNFSWELNLKTLKLLLDHNVKVNAQDYYGRTALHIFLDPEPGDDQPRATLEAVKMFIEAGADLDIKDEDGNTCRQYGLESYNSEIRQYFLDLHKNKKQNSGIKP